MDAFVAAIESKNAEEGPPIVTHPATEGNMLNRSIVTFRIHRPMTQNIKAARQSLSTADWCAGMDTIFEHQLDFLQGVMNNAFDEVYDAYSVGGDWNRLSRVRFVVQINMYYHFKEPGSNAFDINKNDNLNINCEATKRDRIGGALNYTIRWPLPKKVTRRPLYTQFFVSYKYGDCGEGGFLAGLDSKSNFKYVISDAEIMCYKKQLRVAGCAKDIAHANTKIVEGRIIKNVLSPKNMCVIASIRHALGLTKTPAVAERGACRSDHKSIFGRDLKTTAPLPIEFSVLERLGDYYNTDIAIVGESSELSSKSRDSVVTLHYENKHVWLVLADDAGHCRVCDKQYTSVKWLANHRRHCHRCPRCLRIHPSDVICDWCDVCQLNHPTSQACNESKSEFYRNKGSGAEEEAQRVVMKFKRSFLQPRPKQEVLHFDIETAQYPDMRAQVCINVEWAVRCKGDEPVGALVFFDDSPHIYRLVDDLVCEPVYAPTEPTRAFTPANSWRMHSSYGRNSMQEFVDFLSTSTVSYILNAYNGSRFDHIFLLKEWQKRGLYVRDMAFQGSSPILGTLVAGQKVKHRIWDVCRHLCGSLSTNAKAAGLPISKDSFTDFHLLIDDESIAHHQAKLQEYCRKDVQVLTLLYEVTAAEVYSKFGVHIVDYVTTSHMTYTLAFLGSPSSLAERRLEKLDNLKQTPRITKQREAYLKYIDDHKDSSGKWSPISEIWVYRRVALETVFRSALYGGRCYPTQPLWESTQLEAVRQGAIGYADVDDYVLDLDANSLYPTAMSMPMPTGDLHRWTPPQPIPPNLGIYHVKYFPNKKLYNAPLPSRDTHGGLSWSLEDGQGWYTSVDIDSARRFGYRFEYIEGYYWESSERSFAPYIDYLYQAKDRMKQLKYVPGSSYSPALYNQLKLLLNGLWGKTSQRPVYRNVRQVKTEEDLIKFFEEHSNLQFVHCGDKAEDVDYWVQGESLEKSGKISKPVQIADFVLAWSRSIMLDVMDTVDPGLTDCSFLYTDTDSLFVKVNDDNKYRLESLLGPNMGQLSNDLCDSSGGKDGKVIRMVCPSPKAYSAEYILDNDKVQTSIHAKGIHCSFFKTHKKEIESALTDIVDDQFSGEKRQRSMFSWGSDGKVEEEDGDKLMFASSAPYMKKGGAMDGFEISHSHITRKLGKTMFDKRVFFGSDTMSVPLGYVM